MELYTSNPIGSIAKNNDFPTSTINFNDLLEAQDEAKVDETHKEINTTVDRNKLTADKFVKKNIKCKKKNIAVMAIEKTSFVGTKKKLVKVPESKLEDKGTTSAERNIEDHCCQISEKTLNNKNSWLNEPKYHCGMCQRNFKTICGLHVHLITKHQSGGSYHYDEIVKTAYPKYESFSRFTQTEECSFGRSQECDLSDVEKTNDAKGINSAEAEPDTTIDTIDLHYCLSDSDNETIACADISADEIHTDLDTSVDHVAPSTGEISNKDASVKVAVDPLVSDDSKKPMVSKNIRTANKNGQNVTQTVRDSVLKRLRGVKRLKTVAKLKKLGGKSVIVKELRENGNVCETSGISTSPEKEIAIKSVTGKKGVSCELCQVTFTRKESLLRHEQAKHSGQQKHKCIDCDKKFMRKMDLRKHKCKALNDSTAPAKKAKTKNESIHNIDHETKVSIENLKVETCNETNAGESVTVETVTENKDDLGNETHESNENKAFKLSEESSGFPKSKKIKVSRKVKSKAEIFQEKLPYTCELCGHIMPRAKMEIHQRLHTGERPFECGTCGKGLISADKLKRHMLTHSEARRHKCDVCGAGFMMKYKLRMHMHIHTGKKPYLCSICGADFNHSSNLANHTRCVHMQVKPHTCSICGFKFARKSQLEEHEFSHSSERQFTCRYCGKSFKYPKGLKRHEKNHMTPQTKYECDQCSVFFYRKDILTKHKLIHKQDTQEFVCNECKAVLHSHEEFTEHVQTHNKKQTYNCVICKEKFTVANRYYTHMDIMHNVKNDTAKLMLTDCKDGKMSKKVADILAKIPTKILDPNLPLPAEPEESLSTSSKPAESGNTTNTGYNMNHVVSSILDENKATLNALTRVATENLRLHSQDISEEEKAPMLTPPLNPLSVFEKNTRQVPLDHASPMLSYNIAPKLNLHIPSSTHSLDNPDHAYVQSMNQSQSTLMNRLGLPVVTSLNSSINSTLTQLHSIDSLGYSMTNQAMLHIGHFPPFLTGPSTLIAANNVPHNSQSTSIMSSMEHSAIESLSHLQDTSHVPVSGSLVPSSQESLMLAGNQSNMLMSGGILSDDSATDQQGSSFRIQNLY